ncbi:periplasmic heavy metal sensor [Anaeromyxobacter diazotrophicus]|uniref:Periplasmic heavy metal sensor n=1 Tax=Anaeromyxobacter diazotrophicus TaxID=2590199 RepID=A0A7I9VMV2_9BACT|nr:periplasmic heavy metal sensor [Anaeromyxobacter diazotrophicus]GEJ57735.1 hypothetical protein AMYX_24760 [Anaeromyxobacter diazotrophicus]
MKRIREAVAVLAVMLPLGALAQGGPGGPGPMRGGGGPGDGTRIAGQRMRMARTLGLAEALGLDEAQALALRQRTMKLDDRRAAALDRMREAHATLRRAASGEKVAAADVDKAIASDLDARAELSALDRELVGAVTKDLPPEKRARAALFLARFDDRFGPGGGGARGMGGRGMGMRGGMGPAAMQRGAGCPNPECPMRGSDM